MAYFAYLAILMVGPLGGWGAEPNKITTNLDQPPLECVEGEPLTVAIHYEIAPELGAVPMVVELKDSRHNVLSTQTAQVSGTGTRTCTFTVPRRAQTPEVLLAVWYGTDWRQALVPILLSPQIPVLSQEEAADRLRQRVEAERWREQLGQTVAGRGAVAVLQDDLPGLNRELTERLIVALQGHGLTPVRLGADHVTNPFILSTEHFRALVLTNAQVYPMDGRRALERFLSGGGDLIALNTPAFLTWVKKVDGRWLDESQMRELLAKQRPERVLADFESGSAQDWVHTCGPAGQQVNWEFAAGGAGGTGHALHVTVLNYQTWNTFAMPAIEQPFAPGQELTCLWAKGSPQTTQLALEWLERDGSRWIATIPLTTQWQHYALTPAEFAYWPDNPSQGRGGAGDQLRPENAVRFTIGLAMTHTRIPAGRHEFWVDEIGVARNPLGMITLPGQAVISPIELLTPGYKFYPVTNAQALRVSDKQCLLEPAEFPVPAGLMSVQPRPQATGYNKDRKWRWVPLLEALDTTGEVCGTPAALLINRVGRFKDSMIASFALPPSAYQSQAMLELVATVARRMRDGVFLAEGGAEFYAYFQGEPVTLGARTTNLGAAPEPPCQVRFSVTSAVGKEFDSLVPVRDGVAQCQWSPGQFAHDTYQVTCTLVDQAGQVLDMLTHPLVIWQPPARPQYMQIQDGQFVLGGKPWYAHGVNYMPSSGIGIEDGEYFEYWLDKQPYDPVVIERDLTRIAAMGMNTVSIFCYYRSIGSRNLLDILERCRRHGLMVNLSLRPGTPFDFRWGEIKALIETYRLADNDTVFAYDLAWEPVWGGYASRRRWDSQWEQWILERYGSVENAEADWGVPAPRAEGKITSPSDDQLRKEGAVPPLPVGGGWGEGPTPPLPVGEGRGEGDHRVMVCAYRRFLDDLLAKKHAIANGLVKSIDPHHFTSFRMSSAGDPTAGPEWMGFDFRGLARSVDIMEPEGYGRIGGWERVREGRFTADYARCMAPGRPVVWAEFGWAPYGAEALNHTLERMAATADFYRLFYQMIWDSQANGGVCWWYPGGFRYGENSDYGIINPDGSWRPVSHVIREWADRLTSQREPRPVDQWITIDRDATARGLPGVYEAVKERYWALIETGKNPGLRTDGHGLTSVTAPRLAVGNVPYKPGKNPHKYLNAEFDQVAIRNSQGVWQTVTDGSVVKLRKSQPVLVRATVGNIGEATWIAGKGDGRVFIAAGEALAPVPQDVPFMGTARIENFQVSELQQTMDLVIHMLAWPDVEFGEKVTVRVEVE